MKAVGVFVKVRARAISPKRQARNFRRIDPFVYYGHLITILIHFIINLFLMDTARAILG